MSSTSTSTGPALGLGNDDPLAPVGARFPVGRPGAAIPVSTEAPSGPETRPFALRFGRTPAQTDAEVPDLHYSHDRQISLDSDGRPSYLNPQMASRTTVGSKDGGSAPMEDWTPDRMFDEAP